MKIKCTKEQMLLMAALAVDASSAMGWGQLHYQARLYTVKDVERCLNDDGIFGGAKFDKRPNEIHIDYLDGRMVKFDAKQDGDSWDFFPDTPNKEYQSWSVNFATWQNLFDTATHPENAKVFGAK